MSPSNDEIERRRCEMKKHRSLLFSVFAFLAAQSAFSFTKMDVSRVLLMNDDTNTTWEVIGQGYYSTNRADEVYWEHSDEEDPSRLALQSQALWKLNLLPGIGHVLWGTPTGETGIRKLWQLNKCRAGSVATRNSTSAATSTYASGARRNFIPWSGASVAISGTTRMSSGNSFGYAGMVSMLNSTNSWVMSPFYDNLGTIYADAVNGWTDCAVDIVVEIATNTVDGSVFTADTAVDVLEWRKIPFSVFTVKGKATVEQAAENVTSFKLNQSNTNTSSLWGNYFYRIRATVDWRYKPIRFRIRRASLDATAPNEEDPNYGNYLILDNIVASYASIEVDFGPFKVLQDGTKSYDEKRTGTSIVGYEGATTKMFPFVNQTPVYPLAYFQSKDNPYVTNAVPSDFTLENVKYHYRWRYLDQFVGDWREMDFAKNPSSNSMATQYIGKVKMDLSAGSGDVEFYYTLRQTKAPHYEPFDFALGLANPYGAGWVESSPGNLTFRCDEVFAAANGITARTKGRDWFVRIREGESNFRDVFMKYSIYDSGSGGDRVEGDASISMILVDDHTWRAYVEEPRKYTGKSIRFLFHAVECSQDNKTRMYWDTNTYWTPPLTAKNILPISAIADECDDSTPESEWGELLFDGKSGYMMFEYNDQTHAVSVTRCQYQNFNNWTDAVGAGYHGHVIDTNNSAMVGVSSQKKSYVETFGNWEQVASNSASWVESFNVRIGDMGFPTNEMFTTHRTPNGWSAENGMFVAESFSEASSVSEFGMALQMEGRGKGSLTYQDKDKELMPKGIDFVSFAARATQYQSLDDFAWYYDAVSFKNYAVGARVSLTRSGLGNIDFPEKGKPSVSLVGYYRDNRECYEFRLTRLSATEVDMALYRWKQFGGSVSDTLLTNIVVAVNYLSPQEYASGSSKWPAAYLALYTDASTKTTYLTAALADEANTSTMAQNASKFTKNLLYFADDSTNACVRGGSFGVGSRDCPARFGRVMMYNIANVDTTTSKVTPDLATEAASSNELGDEFNWSMPPGRLEREDNLTWGYCIRACDPEQTVRLMLSKVGSGNEWYDSGYSVMVTSFVFRTYSPAFRPRLVDDYNVRICAGGGDDDARVDVLVDDVEFAQWTTTSWTDWSYNGYTNWVYQQCWIGEMADFSDSSAYTCKSIAGSDEYIYVFTKDCKFKPHSDVEVSRALIVGGGGSGGSTMGGGGGGGQVLSVETPFVLSANNEVTITVGKGGVAPMPDGSGTSASSQPAGVSGGKSEIEQLGAKLYTANGGSGGAGWGAVAPTPAQRGSGGGGSGRSGAYLNGAAGVNGNNGGNGANVSGGTGYGGGGGGAGAVGGVASSSANRGGNGGDGIASDITGRIEYYGPGGGGGVRNNANSKGGDGGKSGTGSESGDWGKGANHNAVIGSADGAQPGRNGYGGGGGGGTFTGSNSDAENKKGRAADGGSGVVILRLRAGARIAKMQPRRAKPSDPVMIRSPYLKGISLFSFSYQDADTNTVLRLQLATNDVGTANHEAVSKSLTDSSWVDITNFTFKTSSSGVCTYFFGLREPVCGFVRLLCAPTIVQKAQSSDFYATNYVEYGAITLNKAIAYDEPKLDDTSWYGWNMRTTRDAAYAYLPDPVSYPEGLSCALNFTALRTDTDNQLGDINAAQSGLYTQHDPFVQSPVIVNDAGVGQVQFRARVLDTSSTKSSYVSVYGYQSDNIANETIDVKAEDENWKLLMDVEVTNRTFRIFQWKTMDDISPYKMIRLAVRGAKYGRNSSEAVERPIQRVLIDEIAVTEPITPGVNFVAVSPIRPDFSTSGANYIADATDMKHQPLLEETFGIQVAVQPAQLADQLDVDSIRVFMSYYVGDKPWGYDNWSTNKGAVIGCELARCSDTNLVWRSALVPKYEDSVIPPQRDPGDGKSVVVQYHVWAEFTDIFGTNHTHHITSSEWRNPKWYYPLDLNEDNAGSGSYTPYTILQTISPKRAWINCLNLFDGDTMTAGNCQFIETAAPVGKDMIGWYMRFTEHDNVGEHNQMDENAETFAVFGVNGITSKVPSRDVYNNYAFLSIQSPAATLASGNAADGTWEQFALSSDTLANGSFSGNRCYAVELLRPNGIIEHQIVFGGTNIWVDINPRVASNYNPAVVCEKFRTRDAGTDANWILAGADMTDGTVGVMSAHGASNTDWEQNLAKTSQKRNRRRNGTYQTIPADWYLPSSGIYHWVTASIPEYDDSITQSVGAETNKEISIIMRQGLSTNITYTVAPWHRLGSLISNEVDVVSSWPTFDLSSRTYTCRISGISSNINITAASCVDSRVDALIPSSDRYYNATVKWLENLGEDHGRDITLAELVNRGSTDVKHHLSLKEMYWLDIYPFETNRLIVGIDPLPQLIPVPESMIDTGSQHPALTNLRLKVYMTISNLETSVTMPPMMIQGATPGESSTNYTGRSYNWSSASFKIMGKLNTVEDMWRPLRHFVFNENSFKNTVEKPNEYFAEIDVWDPFSSKAPFSSDPTAYWYDYRHINLWFKTIIDEEERPIGIGILKSVDHLTD